MTQGKEKFSTCNVDEKCAGYAACCPDSTCVLSPLRNKMQTRSYCNKLSRGAQQHWKLCTDCTLAVLRLYCTNFVLQMKKLYNKLSTDAQQHWKLVQTAAAGP